MGRLKIAKTHSLKKLEPAHFGAFFLCKWLYSLSKQSITFLSIMYLINWSTNHSSTSELVSHWYSPIYQQPQCETNSRTWQTTAKSSWPQPALAASQAYRGECFIMRRCQMTFQRSSTPPVTPNGGTFLLCLPDSARFPAACWSCVILVCKRQNENQSKVKSILSTQVI